MKVRFFLANKESEASKKTKEAHASLQKEIGLIRDKVKELGYDSETASEVYRLLSRQHGHPVFMDRTNFREREILGEISQDWKPVFEHSFDYSDLPSMKAYIEANEDKEIVRVHGNEQSVVSFDEFVREMQERPWTKFGMPKRYNKSEETIWDTLR